MRWQNDIERLCERLMIPGITGFGRDDDPDGVVTVFVSIGDSSLQRISMALAEEAVKPLSARFRIGQ